MDDETNDGVEADPGPDDPLDVILEQLSPAEAGELLGVAAAFDPHDPAHVAAWDEVHAIAGAMEGATAEISRIRARVAEWATRGSGVAVGHLGVDVGDDLRRVARTAAADAIVDACVAFMLADRLAPATHDTLLRPWGLPEAPDGDGPDPGETDAGADDPGPG